MPQLFRARRRHHHQLPGHNTFSSGTGTQRDNMLAPLSYLPTTAPRLGYTSGASHFSAPPPLSGPIPIPIRTSSSSYSGSGARELHHDHDLHAGAEPGVNPRSGKSAAEYGHFRQSCVIDVVDYDCDEAVVRRYDNKGFVDFLRGEEKDGGSGGRSASGAGAGEETEDEDSVSLPPRMVRWINIGGIDWDVLSNVALKYNLHSLTLEDILHEQGHTHSKADYYPGHLFIRVLSHTLSREHLFYHPPSHQHEHQHHHHHGHHHGHHSTGEHHEHRGHAQEDIAKMPVPGTTVPPPPGHPDQKIPSTAQNISTLNAEEDRTGNGNGTAAHNQSTGERASEDSIDKTHLLASPQATAVFPEQQHAGTTLAKDAHRHETGTGPGDSAHAAAHPHMQKVLGFLRSHLSLRQRMTALSGFGGPDRERRKRELEALKDGEHRVVVDTRPIFVYLLPDGTVISLQSAPSLDYTAPITERLHRADSVLRTSEDASLLVEGLLDLVVDRVLEVVDEYQAAISHLERDILLYPVMHSVRALHILSGDLIMHKRTLQPIHTMISGLRQYDLERCRAVADNVAAERRFMMSGPDESETELGSSLGAGGSASATQLSGDGEEGDEEDGDPDEEKGEGKDGDEEGDEEDPASALTPMRHNPSAEVPPSQSTSSSTTAGGPSKPRKVHKKDFVAPDEDDDTHPEDPDADTDDTDLQERTKRDRKRDKQKSKKQLQKEQKAERKERKKNTRARARVVDEDPPPAYDVKAKAQRRRQRKRAWLRAERSHPFPVGHDSRQAGPPGGRGGGAPDHPPGAYGPPGGGGGHHYSPDPSHYYGASSQYHDERGYMSPLHRQMLEHRSSGSGRGYSSSYSYGQRPPRVVGYFSYKAKVYLADVSDHMDFALSSLETFAGITENLIDYAFNMASYDMNIVMNRLTLVTIIFLPLTLMTGYFGMNFTPFWSVDQHSDLFFWKIAIPVMAVLVPLFMLDEIRKAVRYVKRRYSAHQAIRYHHRR